MKPLFLLILPCILLACQPQQSSTTHLAHNAYAQGFALTQHDGYTEVKVFSPWKEAELLGHYYLIKDTATITPPHAQRIHIPLTRVVATSATHAGFLRALQATDVLQGICNKHLVYNTLPAACADLGDDMQLSAERILLTHPEAIMLNTYGDADPVPTRLSPTNIPILYNMEWTEQHPLARAEWIRFVGAFLDKQKEADSIFAAVEREYKNTASYLSQSTLSKRSILSGNNFRGTWYVPAGNTYMGQLFQDAGADYHFAADSRTTSIPLSIETCLLHFQDADIWVGSNCRTRTQLAALDEKHTWFKAYQQGEVYNFERRSTPAGANDFWETGTVHPEYILQDLIWVLYPTLLPTDYQPYFTSKLL